MFQISRRVPVKIDESKKCGAIFHAQAAARWPDLLARHAGGHLCAGALSLALFASTGVAWGQTSPGTDGAQEKLNLSPSQERAVSQGEQSQPAAPGYQGQVGSKIPDSMNAQQLSDQVTTQVPQTKSYLFVKLPDRILLIHADTKLVAEIVAVPAGTTGNGSSDSPSR